MVSPALVELALRPWGRAAVGSIVHHSAERLVELWTSFPIAGPNHAALIRCAPDRVAAMVQETQALAGSHGKPLAWILDPEARPADLADRLVALGFEQTEELDVMVFPASAPLDGPAAAVQIVDALADVDTFATAEAVQAAAFGDGPVRGQLQRFNEARADPARHFLLARVDGKPAGAGWATMRRAGGVVPSGSARRREGGTPTRKQGCCSTAARSPRRSGARASTEQCSPLGSTWLGRLAVRELRPRPGLTPRHPLFADLASSRWGPGAYSNTPRS